MYGLFAALLLLPLLVQPHACPFGLHDWSFPCYPEQARHFFAIQLAPWVELGLGSPNPAPHVNPIVAPLYLVASLAPDIALRAMLWSFLAGAGIAADIAVLRLFGVSAPVARFVAGVTYIGSPFFATKLASGHYFFLLDATLVPIALVAFAAIPRGGIRAWCIAALCTSLALVQVQVGAIVLALLPLIAWRRIAARYWVGIWIVALLAFTPAIYSAIAAYRSGGLSTEVQLAAWLRDESIPWRRVLDSTYYFANYFGSVAGNAAVIAWQWLSPACVLLAIVAGGLSRRLAIAAIALGALATGETGPLAGIITPIFAHVPVASVFRELYDLLALAPLVVSGGCAIAVSFLASRLTAQMRVGAASAFGAIIGIALWPSLAAKSAGLVPLADPRLWQSEVHMIAAHPGDDRVLWLPTVMPLGPLGTPGGADPFDMTGPHPAAHSYHPTGLFAYAAALADRTGSLNPALARRLGIGAIVVRQRVVSRRLMAAAWPAGGLIAPPPQPPQFIPGAGPLALASSAPECEPDLRSDMRPDIAYVRCEDSPLYAPLEDPEHSLDAPDRGWVQGERWSELDAALAAPRWPVLFTRSAEPFDWVTSASGQALVYAPGGGHLDGTALEAQPNWEVVPMAAGPHALQGDGHHVIAVSATLRAPATRHASHFSPFRPFGRVHAGQAIETATPTAQSNRIWGRYTATLPPHAAGLLVLRESFSPDWIAAIDGRELGRPVLADGYATGWLLAASSAPSHVSIAYAPLAAYAMLVALALLVWLALLAGAVFYRAEAPAG